MTQYPSEVAPQSSDNVKTLTDAVMPNDGGLKIQRILQSPVYLLLRGDANVKQLIQAERMPLPLLAAVDEARWLNLLVADYIQALLSGSMTIAQLLAKRPQWHLPEGHYDALREPEIRLLINEGIFTFDRYTRLNGRQIEALRVSAGLRTELLQRKVTAPYFLRHSPSQLAELVSSLDVPKAAL